MWGDFGKLIVAKGFKSCPNSNKSPNLVTLVVLKLLQFYDFLKLENLSQTQNLFNFFAFKPSNRCFCPKSIKILEH